MTSSFHVSCSGNSIVKSNENSNLEVKGQGQISPKLIVSTDHYKKVKGEKSAGI